jgi:hypothetical protein
MFGSRATKRQRKRKLTLRRAFREEEEKGIKRKKNDANQRQ